LAICLKILFPLFLFFLFLYVSALLITTERKTERERERRKSKKWQIIFVVNVCKRVFRPFAEVLITLQKAMRKNLKRPWSKKAFLLFHNPLSKDSRPPLPSPHFLFDFKAPLLEKAGGAWLACLPVGLFWNCLQEIFCECWRKKYYLFGPGNPGMLGL